MMTPRTFCTFSREFSSLRVGRGCNRAANLIPDTILRVYSCDLWPCFAPGLQTLGPAGPEGGRRSAFHGTDTSHRRPIGWP
jgi:hypothetical protein